LYPARHGALPAAQAGKAECRVRAFAKPSPEGTVDLQPRLHFLAHSPQRRFPRTYRAPEARLYPARHGALPATRQAKRNAGSTDTRSPSPEGTVDLQPRLHFLAHSPQRRFPRTHQAPFPRSTHRAPEARLYPARHGALPATRQAKRNAGFARSRSPVPKGRLTSSLDSRRLACPSALPQYPALEPGHRRPQRISCSCPPLSIQCHRELLCPIRFGAAGAPGAPDGLRGSISNRQSGDPKSPYLQENKG